MVHHDHPVAVAVEGDAEIGALLLNQGAQNRGMGGTAVLIDVQSIRGNANWNHGRAHFIEHTGRDVVGRAMGAVHHDFQARQTGVGGHRALAEFNVAASGVHDALGLAQGVGLGGGQRLLQQFLDVQFDHVGQLLAIAGEELDAVVVIGIVGGADHDAGAGVQGTGQVGDARRWHRPQQGDVDPGRRQARFQGGFEHVAGDAGVLADDYLIETLGLQRPSDRPAQFQHEFRRDRVVADPPANAIRTKIVFSHALSPCLSAVGDYSGDGDAARVLWRTRVTRLPSAAAQTHSACMVSRTSWVRMMLAPCQKAMTVVTGTTAFTPPCKISPALGGVRPRLQHLSAGFLDSTVFDIFQTGKPRLGFPCKIA